MRYQDDDEAIRLNAEPWQLALLKANPTYCAWGPNEDYMTTEGDGWNSRIIVSTWAEFGPLELDDLNECVNFYFACNRSSETCAMCGGNGYHPDAHIVSETFYAHQCEARGFPSAGAWHDKITQDEVQALIDGGRLHDLTHDFVAGEGWKPKATAVLPTAAEVNAMQHGRGFGHDAINRMILIAARLKRLGLPKTCPACDGDGETFTEPAAHVSLVLWWLHPRKGCSRGIEVTRIQRDELPAVQAFLKSASDRNAERFAGIGFIA